MAETSDKEADPAGSVVAADANRVAQSVADLRDVVVLLVVAEAEKDAVVVFPVVLAEVVVASEGVVLAVLAVNAVARDLVTMMLSMKICSNTGTRLESRINVR